MKARDIVIIPLCGVLLVIGTRAGWKRADKWLEDLLDWAMRMKRE